MATYASIEVHELQTLRDRMRKNASLRTALAAHAPLNAAKGNYVQLLDGTLRALGVESGEARSALIGTGGGLWSDNYFPASAWRGDCPPGAGRIEEGIKVLGQSYLYSFSPGNPAFDEACPLVLRQAIESNLNIIFNGQGVMAPALSTPEILSAFSGGIIGFRLAAGGRVWRQLYSLTSNTLNDLQHSASVASVFKAAALAVRLHFGTVYGLFAYAKDVGNIINLPGNDIADANPDN